MQKDLTPFTSYQKFLIALIAFIQFTVILDFMVMSPLGAAIMRVLVITPKQFGMVVSAYAISAGLSGILAAGFADKFDRKKMLLFFYCGFVVGTFFCGMAADYQTLLIARIVTGIFGGVIGSISMAIIADAFALQMRGRVMGFVQTAFAASQIIGLPLGMKLNTLFDWHAPFLLIAGFCVPAGLIMAFKMRPVTDHLKIKSEHSPFKHLAVTAGNPIYLRAFAATILLSAGGFMIMPFATDFLENNVGIREADLFWIYMCTGCVGIITGPLIGRLADKVGKFRVFIGGSILGAIMVLINTNLGITPLWEIMVLNALMFTAITSRMIPTSALVSAVPDMKDRGAFMSINSSIQQMSGGVAALIGGTIIIKGADHKLIHYNTLGYLMVAAFIISGIMMYYVNEIVRHKVAREKQAKEAAENQKPAAVEI